MTEPAARKSSALKNAWVTRWKIAAEYAVTPQGLVRKKSWPTVRDAYCVAVVPATGRLVVASEADSQLQLIDP